MFIAPSQQSFLINSLTPLIQKPKTRLAISTISCRHLQDDHNDSCRTKSENQLAKLAIVTLAAGVLTLGSVGDASAAKSGGPIYVNPPVAPPLVGGYGYGFGVPFYGGWGWSPFSFFAPGPSVAIVGGGFETLALFLFLGAVAAVIRRFNGSRDEDEY
ncbi:hypothetical protein GH714_015836 [Hevea brasiliensis]|uniref:Uncharacterized protein n=1 Tax=Hevea brasiliensis TaxID=3981 RepID=A0A6A6MVS2_HEVBR|nr:hypothetical protein GH714_015836 [Hevea brasiliensis]